MLGRSITRNGFAAARAVVLKQCYQVYAFNLMGWLMWRLGINRVPASGITVTVRAYTGVS